MGLTPPGGSSHPRSFTRSLARTPDLIHPSISLLIIKSLSPLSLSSANALLRALGCSKKVCQKIEGVLVKKFNVPLFSLQPEIHYKKFKLVILLACRPAVRGNFFVQHHPLERRGFLSHSLSARSLSHLLST
jgi:hypothetical protein